MPKVKAGIISLTISEKIAVGRDRVTALTGNTVITIDPAKLAQFTSAVNGLLAAQAEVGNGQILLNEKYARQADADKEYNLQTLMMVSEINSLTQDEAKLATTGFPISEVRTAEPGLLSTSPSNVIATMGKKTGEISLKWKSVKSSQGYIIEYSPEANFTDTATKTEIVGKLSKVMLKGLPTGSNIWIRIRGVKGTDKGPWSDPATTLIP